MRNNVALVYGSAMHVVSLLAQQYFFQLLMNASDFVRSPVKMGGGLPISLSPGFGPTAAVAGTPGFPPPPTSTSSWGSRVSPPGILADCMGNPRPVNGCVGGSGCNGLAPSVQLGPLRFLKSTK